MHLKNMYLNFFVLSVNMLGNFQANIKALTNSAATKPAAWADGEQRSLHFPQKHQVINSSTV